MDLILITPFSLGSSGPSRQPLKLMEKLARARLDERRCSAVIYNIIVGSNFYVRRIRLQSGKASVSLRFAKPLKM